MKKPNIVFVLTDQWRKQATGYNGDPNVKTPNLDQLAKESLNLTNAISACPVCTPYRASFLTGQYPLTTGLFTNDVPLDPETLGLGDAFKAGDDFKIYSQKAMPTDPDVDLIIQDHPWANQTIRGYTT